MINWHRLFGLTLCDYFTGTRYVVELEKDIARKRQVLDVLIIRSEQGEPLTEPCDGLEGLRPHNLLTYKSGQESLDAWALEELIGHYVNYRKAFAHQAPRQDFGLYAVSTRHPRALFSEVPAEKIRDGVFRLRVLNRDITLIVPKEVEPHPRNALWELFSFEVERVAQGAKDYHWRQSDYVPILEGLYQYYPELGDVMAYTIQDFHRDLARERLKKMSAREILSEFSPEEILNELSPDDLRRGIAPEKLVDTLLSEESLQGLSKEKLARLRAYLDETLKLDS